ncbi:MAG: thioredoxin family protein [Saprospiraceae bacterium]|nr:thioredoxin family protein [Saprospiraceae bacterium]
MQKPFFLLMLGMFTFLSCSKENLVPANTTLEEVTDLAAYNAKINSGVSIVFFHATWCTKCAAQRPAVEELTLDNRFNTVFFGQVDYEKNKTIVNQSDVTGFPTILIFKDGVEKARYESVGTSKTTLENKLLELL